MGPLFLLYLGMMECVTYHNQIRTKKQARGQNVPCCCGRIRPPLLQGLKGRHAKQSRSASARHDIILDARSLFQSHPVPHISVLLFFFCNHLSYHTPIHTCIYSHRTMVIFPSFLLDLFDQAAQLGALHVRGVRMRPVREPRAGGDGSAARGDVAPGRRQLDAQRARGPGGLDGGDDQDPEARATGVR